uniref:F-box domain-containing protein n=1 Tax=Arundo donax TaxID=35708 RepID=A0A0A8ZH94_ARUDO
MASPATLTEDLLAEIFLRLPEPADLVRASAACVSYSRIIADRAFLRRFRALHPAPLLGFLEGKRFQPALPPHASAPAARAVSLAADFSFSFLPSRGRWLVRDVRDGRVLLDRAPEGERRPVFSEIAVCDPLHRRCVLFPPIPDDLAASVEHPLRMGSGHWCEPFLAPRGADNGEDETSFGVVWMTQCKSKLLAFAFSSSTRQWRAVASLAWSDLMSGAVPSRSPALVGRQYAHRCFYWVMYWQDKLLVLDTRRMEFSTSDLPPGCDKGQIAIVEAGEGRVGMFTLRDHIADGAVSLHYSVRRHDGDCSNPWQMEKIIPLDPAFRHYIRGAMERYLLLLRFPEHLCSPGVHVSSSVEGVDLECFSLDVNTFQLERVCDPKHHILRAHIYTNFPPSLSSQSI